jgi:hypothetical protein
MRKFTQVVSMPCNQVEYIDCLRDGLASLGYNKLEETDKDFYSIEVNFCGHNGDLTCSYVPDNYRDCVNIAFDPELFLALAAMSEGDEFYPGEYGVCLEDLAGTGSCKKGAIYKIQSVGIGRDVQIEDEWVKGGGEKGGWTSPENFRKATFEELVTHFAPKSMADPNEELIPVFKEYGTKTEPYGVWAPAFGELCQFHSDHSLEREKRFFLGINSAGKYIATDANPNEVDVAETGRVSVHDYCDKFGAPVNIPLKEAQDVFAGIYNVFPEQIKIVE